MLSVKILCNDCVGHTSSARGHSTITGLYLHSVWDERWMFLPASAELDENWALNVQMSNLGKLWDTDEGFSSTSLVHAETSGHYLLWHFKMDLRRGAFQRNNNLPQFNNKSGKESEEISFVTKPPGAFGRKKASCLKETNSYITKIHNWPSLLVSLHVPLSLPPRPPSPAGDTERSECLKTLLVDAACHMPFQ